jgi:hypothetical protein
MYSRTFITGFIPSYETAGLTFLTGGNQPAGCVLTLSNVGPSSGCTTLFTAPGNYNCPTAVAANCVVLAGFVKTPVASGARTCQWTCSCGAGTETFRIDNSHGLPVELMEFSVDDTGETEESGDPAQQ